MITSERVCEQEACFARAFESGDLEIARPLYHPEVIYLSPTVRLFDWPARIAGVEKTLAFIRVTVRALRRVRYRAVEHAVVAGADVAFVRVHFDWDRGDQRLRSRYVVIYRYRDGRIGQQEIYYDPSGRLEVIGAEG